MNKNFKGFTLIEILVTISVIGLLSSVILTSLSATRAKGRDAIRLSDANQIEKALILYYEQNGYYPKRESAYTGSGLPNCPSGNPAKGSSSWCGLYNDLLPYMPLPQDPSGVQNNYRYYYDSDSGDGYGSYGLMVRLEHSSNYSKASGDGGYWNSNGSYYEVGIQPSYCTKKYLNAYRIWWSATTNVCAGGN